MTKHDITERTEIVYEGTNGEEKRIESPVMAYEKGSMLVVEHRDHLVDEYKYTPGAETKKTRIPLERVVKIDG
jgi:hypothetical protein